jgi:hypothetical protein
MNNPEAVLVFETLLRNFEKMRRLDEYIDTYLKDGSIAETTIPSLIILLVGMLDPTLGEKDAYDVLVIFSEYIIGKNDFLKTNDISQAEFTRFYYNCASLELLKRTRTTQRNCACVIS